LIDLKLHDLSNVVAFAKVVEAKSFTAAARQLGMSKATISKQVSTLEKAYPVVPGDLVLSALAGSAPS